MNQEQIASLALEVEKTLVPKRMFVSDYTVAFAQAFLARAIEQELGKQEPVAWRVVGNYTDQPSHDKASAEAYCRGLLTTDPEGGYRVKPLFDSPQSCPRCKELEAELESRPAYAD